MFRFDDETTHRMPTQFGGRKGGASKAYYPTATNLTLTDNTEPGETRKTVHADYEGPVFWEQTSDTIEDLTAEMNQPFGDFNIDLNWMGWQYIPNIGRPAAVLNDPTLFPQHIEHQSLRNEADQICWTPLNQEQTSAQANRVAVLSALPMNEMLYASIGDGNRIMYSGRDQVLL